MPRKSDPQLFIANDNADRLTPDAFATLMAQMMSAYGRMFDGDQDASREYEAKSLPSGV